MINKLKGILKKVNINKKILISFEALISGCACVQLFKFNTSNIFALVLFVLFYGLFKRADEIEEKNIKLCSSILGFLFMSSLFLANLGILLKITPEYLKWFFMICYIFGFYFLFKNLTAVIYKKFLNFSLKKEYSKYSKKYSIILFFGGMLIMLACWVPYFLKDFPGVVTADSYNQIMQCLGKFPLSNHHPIAHTFTIKLLFELGMKLFNGSQTMAIATYSVCQAIFLSASFSYLLITLYKFKINKIFIFLVFAFYAIMPYHGVFSITMWKDVFFGGIVLILITTVWRLIEYFKNNKKLPVFEFIMFVIFGIAMCLFRSNGWYAYIVFAPFVFFVFRKKSLCIALAALAIIPTVFIIKGPIYNSADITQPDTIESLSIPAQHIARAITDGAELTEEQYNLLSKVVDVEEIPNRYESFISDPIKNLVRDTDNQEFLEKNKMEFLKLWINLGIKNPSSYVLAQIDQTYGYWYPDTQYWVFSNKLFNKGLDYSRVQILSVPTSESFLEYMHSYKLIPYYGLFWSIGTFTWIFAFMLGFCFIKRDKNLLLLYIPLVAILATLMIATPVYSEFRYIYSLFTTMPLFITVPFMAKTENDNNITAKAVITE